MSRKFSSLLCLFSAISCGAAVAATTSTAPVAYVYVGTNAPNQVVGYAASASGQLTSIPGSPFYAELGSMAVNGKYLFGSDNVPGSDRNVYSYLMESNGSLKYLGATDIQANTGLNPTYVTLDHTGATLYVFSSDGYDGNFASYNVAKPTGKLTYLSETTSVPNSDNFPLTFIGNNVLAFQAVCDPQENDTAIFGFQRQSGGSLTDISIDAQYPTAPGSTPYCPQFSTADTTNHLAVDETGGGGEDQIASYTVDTTDGNLNTTSTAENMPHTAVDSVQAMGMSPSGKLLAVGGTNGLQIFHFNGADPLTVDTGLLTSDDIENVYFDNANHLYATSSTGGKLFVFTVTSTGAIEAPGSPYTVSHPGTLIVQPK
jgi:hypothetical protein